MILTRPFKPAITLWSFHVYEHTHGNVLLTRRADQDTLQWLVLDGSDKQHILLLSLEDLL